MELERNRQRSTREKAEGAESRWIQKKKKIKEISFERKKWSTEVRP